MPHFRLQAGLCTCVLFLLLLSPAAVAAEVFTVATEAQLRAAIAAAGPGDTIVFAADISLTAGDLPALGTSVTIDGAGHVLFLLGHDFLQLATPPGTTSLLSPPIFDSEGLLGPQGDGRWSLDKTGAGTLVLGGANRYTGGTFVDDGRLNVSSAQNLGLGIVALTNSSTLGITASATFFQDLFLLDTPAIDVAPGASVTWSGVIEDFDGVGRLQITGGGTLLLGNADNGYSGGTLVTGGSTVAVTDNGALGALSGNVTLGDDVSSGTLAISSPSFLSSRSFVLGGGGGLFAVQGSSNATLRGVISGTGSLTKTGTGTLMLAAANTYTGPTTVAAGTLAAGATNVFGINSAMTVDAGATLSLNSFNQTVGSLAGAGSVTLGSATLTAGGNNTTTLFSGAMSGTGGLVKVGTGALVLTGGNSYSGGTLVSAGALVGNSTSLQGSITNNSLVVFDQAVNGIYAGVMNGTGTLAKIGAGTLVLTGANSYSGGTTVTGNGAVAIGVDNGLGAAAAGVILGDEISSGGVNFTAGSTFSAIRPFTLGAAGGIFDTGAGSSISLTGSISGAGGLTKAGAGLLTLAGSNSYTGATNVVAGVLRAGAQNVFGVPGVLNVAGGATVDLDGFNQTVSSLSGSGGVALGSAALSIGESGGSSIFSGVISGTGSLVKAGAGTLMLTGVNTYSGGTTVLGGTLAGNTTSLQGNITNNALVIFDQNGDGTYAGSMNGSGALAKTGNGNLTLTGSNTYTGGTFIEAGSLTGTPTSVRGTIVNNASLTIDTSGQAAFGGVLGGSGNFFKTGAGTLVFSGTHSFGGTTTISDGTLQLDGFLGGGVSIAPGATLRASGALGGSVSVAGSLFVVPPPETATTLLNIAGASGTTVGAGDSLVVPSYLTIGGSLTASGGSLLAMPIGPGTNPTVLVGGRASLSGTQFTFDATLPADQRSASFLALTALDGLTMANTTAVTQSPALVPLLKQDNRSLLVTLLNYEVPLRGEVTTSNAISVAEAIDRIKMRATGDRADVIKELTALDDDALDAALESMAGELHATSVQLGILESESFTDLVRNQLTARAHDAEEADVDGWAGQKIRWWSQLTGEYATLDPAAGSRGAIARFGSGAGGMDLRLSNRWLFGAGGGFGAGNMGLRGLSGDTDFQAPRAFGYVGYKPSGFGIRGGGSASRVSYQKRRRVSFAATLPAEFGLGLLTGGIDREAESEEAGLVSDTWGEYDDSLEVKTYVLDWMLGMRQARFARGGFSETGAGIALSAVEQVLTLRHTDVKLHLWRKSGNYRPYLETMFRRELTDGITDMTLRFADEPDSDFTVDGAPVPGNLFLGRGGVTMMTRLGAWTFEYAIRKAAGQMRHTADVRMRFR